MFRTQTPDERSDLLLEVTETRRGGSFLDIDAWIPSEAKAISPLLDRLMRLVEGSQWVAGEELAVEMALREALNNAVLPRGFHERIPQKSFVTPLLSMAISGANGAIKKARKI